MARAELRRRNIEKCRAAIPIESLYTAGTGGQLFFRALKEKGQIVGTRCDGCAQVYVPARRFCERCFAELSTEVIVKPEGIVKSFSYSYIDRHGRRLTQPATAVMVQLDGATTVMLHRLVDAQELPRLTIGSRVQAVIKPKAQRRGSILDIDGFRLIA